MHATLYAAVGGTWVGLLAVFSTQATATELSSAEPAVAEEGLLATGESLAHDPEGIDGVLLLRNKNLLAGRIARLGQRYRVVEPGAVIFVPAEQVWRCCRSRVDAYAFLRGTSERLLARDHLELAQWCLRNELLPQAARELLDARTLQSNLPTLPLVERQLRQRLRLAAAEDAAAEAGAPIQTPGVTPVSIAATISHDRRGQSDRQIEPARPVDASRAVRAEFARRIQPMLVQNCTTSGCHTPDGAESFKLDRLALAGGGHPELTRRNLAATLSDLDLDQPSESQLYDYARRRHGPAGNPATPLRRRQAVLLLQWLEAAAGFDPMSEQVVEDASEPGPIEAVVYPAPQEPTQRDQFDPAIFNAQSP